MHLNLPRRFNHFILLNYRVFDKLLSCKIYQLHLKLFQSYFIVIQNYYDQILKSAYSIIKDKQNYSESDIQKNSSVNIEGYKIWGSPYSPTIPYNPWAFQVDSKDGEQFWKQIEEGSDIVLTHGAPLGPQSFVNYQYSQGEWGDEALAKRIKEVKPLYHIFGHVHENQGMIEEDGIKYINCAILDEAYRLSEEPFVFKLPRRVISQKENEDKLSQD
ncbi:unnamed protein product [Paramecium sonneborni]|uniref:Calcineurin-like phosphoesterase domain-containing protein n=1 Tax=Paramecium sonneborni TaxID=65129 RepID=A0A8S1RKU6_9CILI|nr:unnamed protein product [Paramecium sonneborni]